MYRNLRQFIADLVKRKDLVTITSPVDPCLEIAEIHRRVIAAGGPALLFTNVKGKNFPVVTNLFGSPERVALAFGPRPAEFIRSVAKLPEELLPPSLGKLWGQRRLFTQAARIGFKMTSAAPVLHSEIAGADLTALPALTSWQEDGGPFVTLPLVHTSSPSGKGDNLGMYRVQIFEPHEAGMHFQIGRGGGFHLYEAEERGEGLPLNLYLGGPPALILAAIAPLPENIPELMLASLVAGEKLRLGKGYRDSGRPSPVAEAEFFVQGEVPAHIRRPEGPFGDHYGYYSLQHPYPVFRPQRIFHRRDAIFPATVVGKPRQEDFYLGDYLQELLSPLYPLVMPAVQDLWSYGETGYHALSAACLKERYGREAMASVFRILGEGQLSLTKFLIATDKPMDLKKFSAVLSYVLARVDWRKDLYIFSELSMDSLDYSGPEVSKGSKGVLLGMGEPIRQLPQEFHHSSAAGQVIKRAIPFCPGCLVVEIASYEDDPTCVEGLSRLAALADWPLIIAVDNAVKATRSEAAFLWTTFTRFEPAADIYARSHQIVRHHLVYEGPIVIDARMKPNYPKELFCDDQTRELVNRRWREYFPAGKVEMGSSDDAHLYDIS